MLLKILGLFVNPLTADDKCSLLNRGNLLRHFQMQLYQKTKIFSQFFLAFWKFIFNFEHFQKKGWPMQLMYFWIYGLRKTCLDKCLKSPLLLLKSERDYLYNIYWSLWREFRLNKSHWLLCKILGLFVNPFTAHEKYSLLNRDYLMQHIQMQLSKKKKVFLVFFFFLHFRNLD